MLTIREEQMAVFREYMRKQFEDRMVAHLQETFSLELVNTPEAELRPMVREGIEKAEDHGVTFEDDVEYYLECTVRYGPDFGTAPNTSWAGGILDDDTLTGPEKMGRIHDYELFALEGGSNGRDSTGDEAFEQQGPPLRQRRAVSAASERPAALRRERQPQAARPDRSAPGGSSSRVDGPLHREEGQGQDRQPPLARRRLWNGMPEEGCGHSV